LPQHPAVAYLFLVRPAGDLTSAHRYPRYLSVAIALASDKIAVITIIPKAASSIK
jgi:hypothetical protein